MQRGLSLIKHVWLVRLAVVAALAMRLAFPAGTMPVATSMGIEVGLCSEDPSIQRLVIQIEREPTSHDKAAKGSECPFAVAAAALDMPPAPAAIAPPLWRTVIADHETAFATAPGRGLAAPPPFATGPPAIL